MRRDPILLDRRQALSLLAAAGAGTVWPSGGLAAEEAPLYVAAARLPDRSFAVVLIDGSGRERRSLPLPGRGHDFAVDTRSGLTVAFARRPGTFAVAFNARSNMTPTVFTAPRGRHFYGHGAFSADGRLLYATENDFETGRGLVGLYEVAADFRRVGEFPSGGIGPHEVLLLRDCRTLAVANGGILTHPDWPRTKLNLETMRPNLAYVDIHSGDVSEILTLPPELHRLSIRHLTEPSDWLWFGCQWEGVADAEVGLVGRHRRGGELELLSASPAIWAGMDHYVGSLSVGGDGRTVATSSPRGGTVTLWSVETGRPMRQSVRPDVCGLAPHATGVAATDGSGGFSTMSGRSDRELVRNSLAFDNHLRRL